MPSGTEPSEQDVAVSSAEAELAQAAAFTPVAVSVRSTQYPAGTTPLTGAVHETAALELPAGDVAATPDGATSVPVEAVPVPRPPVVQKAHAVPDTPMRTVRMTRMPRARTPRFGAARRARGFGVARGRITARPPQTTSG